MCNKDSYEERELEREREYERSADMDRMRYQDQWEQEQAKIKKDLADRATRIDKDIISKLSKALQMSAIIDENGDALVLWTDDMINEIIDSVT